MNNLERNAMKLGLYKYNKIIIEEIIKILGKIPFVYNNNPTLIDNIFNEIISNYENNKNNRDLVNKIKDFHIYYNNTWLSYLNNKILNYMNIENYKRSNSFIKITINI